jgi:Cytochrome P450
MIPFDLICESCMLNPQQKNNTRLVILFWHVVIVPSLPYFVIVMDRSFDASVLWAEPWRIVASLSAALFVRSVVQTWMRPKNLPPFYFEYPYIPWLGSLVQFATGPREFIQRAAAAKGDVFTIQLFGKQMTFLTGSAGHAHFFKAKEHEFDIREAYAMTVITFGPGVCYDCPQSKMAQQFAFFKDGLSDKCFVEYMELVQDEVSKFFEAQWGEEGEADLLASLSDVFTLTSSRCLLGDEIRQRWNSSGMAEHYCTYCIHTNLRSMHRCSRQIRLSNNSVSNFASSIGPISI